MDLPRDFMKSLCWLIQSRSLSAKAVAIAFGIPLSHARSWVQEAQSSLSAVEKPSVLPILTLDELPAHRVQPLTAGKLRSPTSPHAPLLLHVEKKFSTMLSLDQAAAWASMEACIQFSWLPAYYGSAREGEDGLYHLRLGTEFVCCSVHHLVSSGLKGKKLKTPIKGDLLRVKLTRFSINGSAVREGLRCSPQDVRWPVFEQQFHHVPGKLRSIMTEIQDITGISCSCCHNWAGTVVDHDHYTGRVRGGLCLSCNRNVDPCPHLSGCIFADYLNAPPVTWEVQHPTTNYSKAPLWRPGARN